MDAIIDCTSQVFEGLISLADPSRSWVAKWQRLDGYVKGVYATKVSGQLPDEVVAVMEDEARIKYIPLVLCCSCVECWTKFKIGGMGVQPRRTDG